MDSFNFVVFGFTSNLAQLKIIPALYDLESKGLLPVGTRIIGIGRKDIDCKEYVTGVLHNKNRHHVHNIDSDVENRLLEKTEYHIEDFEDKNKSLYKKLKNLKGNILYYLATYPNLYLDIFQSLKDYGLNEEIGNSWVRILIEKPIGNDLVTARNLDNVLNNYFDEKQIFRVDHYLGKEALRQVFDTKIDSKDADRIEIIISENFGVGKRGVYYDAIGALKDMGQNHMLQMIAAVAAKNSNREERAEVLESLVPETSNIIFGQYEGYLNEENVSPVSITDTYFALKTKLSNGPWKNIPIYFATGKMLDRNEIKISIFYKDDSEKIFTIYPPEKTDEFDPYERLIIDAVNGNQTFFNSKREIEASWKFIDKLSQKSGNPFVYKPGSNLCDGVSSKFSS